MVTVALNELGGSLTLMKSTYYLEVAPKEVSEIVPIFSLVQGFVLRILRILVLALVRHAWYTLLLTLSFVL